MRASPRATDGMQNAPAVSVAGSRDSTVGDSDPMARTVVTAWCVAQSHVGIPACSAVEVLPRTLDVHNRVIVDEEALEQYLETALDARSRTSIGVHRDRPWST